MKTETVSLRSPTVKSISRRLATLGHIRIEKGSALNVRRRENVRRALAEAGEELGWSAIGAASDDPVKTVSKDLKKMLRSGVRSLTASLADELAEKKEEAARLEEILATVTDMSEDPATEYPQEITYSYTSGSTSKGFVTKTETVVLADATEALRAAKKIERSLPRWGRLQEEMVLDMHQRQESLDNVGRNLSEVVTSWRILLGEVLVTIR